MGVIQRNREESKMTNDNWTQSPFAWLEETQLGEYIEPPPVDPLDTLIDDLLPRIRFEGEQLETDLSPAGMTEWIPGVDPVGELVEESILPPLPPAVTTLMRSYVRGTETLPAGSGHVNIIVDLSGSMNQGVGNDSSGQRQTVATCAQALTRIAVNACRQGGHSFAIFAFGSCSGDGQGGYAGNASRQIWGTTLEEAKDYDGYLASLKANGSGMQGDWNGMGGTQSGAATMRLFNYMKDDVGSQIPDVTAATAFVITDAYWGDITVPGLNPNGAGNVDVESIQNNGRNSVGADGFWYYTKQYHDNFGPCVLFKINGGARGQTDTESGLAKAYRKAYKQYVSGGRSNYDKCVFCDVVFVDNSGGNLGEVANRMVKFINDMGGGAAGVPECGGKGVTF